LVGTPGKKGGAQGGTIEKNDIITNTVGNRRKGERKSEVTGPGSRPARTGLVMHLKETTGGGSFGPRLKKLLGRSACPVQKLKKRGTVPKELGGLVYSNMIQKKWRTSKAGQRGKPLEEKKLTGGKAAREA